MRATKTMLLGLIIMLMGFGFFVMLMNINLGSYMTFGPVNTLIDPFISQYSGGSVFEYLARVAQIIRTEEYVALAVIGLGLLTSFTGYFRKERA